MILATLLFCHPLETALQSQGHWMHIIGNTPRHLVGDTRRGNHFTNPKVAYTENGITHLIDKLKLQEHHLAVATLMSVDALGTCQIAKLPNRHIVITVGKLSNRRHFPPSLKPQATSCAAHSCRVLVGADTSSQVAGHDAGRR